MPIQIESPLIEIRNATVYRGQTRVFDQLNLSIARHEQVAIVGPNGAGKTTLLKLIHRDIYPVLKPDSVVRVLGSDRWNVWELRQQIGVVSHDLHTRYTPTTTAMDVVLSGFHSSFGVHGQLAQQVSTEQVRAAEATLRSLDLSALRDTALQRMSTGQQRRCLLGRALVHDPETLILDEPTAGLDLAAAFDYLRRLRELAQDGRNIVLVTHHLNEIPPEIDRIILLSQGRVVADGPKARVLTPARLSEVYGTDVCIAQVSGYFLAYPGRSANLRSREC